MSDTNNESGIRKSTTQRFAWKLDECAVKWNVGSDSFQFRIPTWPDGHVSPDFTTARVSDIHTLICLLEEVELAAARPGHPESSDGFGRRKRQAGQMREALTVGEDVE